MRPEGMCFTVSEGPNQDQGGELIPLAGGIVRHGVLNLLIRQREIAAFAQLTPFVHRSIDRMRKEGV